MPTRYVLIVLGLFLLAPAALADGLLRVSEENPRYFVDESGRPVFLSGLHDGWELQDYAWGDANPGVLFDWDGFLDTLSGHGLNVYRMWCVEHTKIIDNDPDLTTPMPYERVEGQGLARDGQPRFDLTRLNDAYFDRLRKRTEEADARGIYTIVMLFQGWSIEDKGGRVNPWPYHPFHGDNNVNGIDGDLDGDGQGVELHTWLGADHPITGLQRAYIGRVVESVNHVDRVLYEVANESHYDSVEWQHAVIETIHEFEAGMPKQHPAGVTAPYGRQRRPVNDTLLSGPGDWISPSREQMGPHEFGTNPPPWEAVKPVLSDTDHLFGNQCRDFGWAWRTFTRGHNLLYMDMWTQEPDDPARHSVRRALGVIATVATEVDLIRLTPRPEIASTSYCLADPGRTYVAYLPEGGEFTLDLAEGGYSVEWVHPVTGERTQGPDVEGGAVALRAPHDGPAVVVLRAASGRG